MNRATEAAAAASGRLCWAEILPNAASRPQPKARQNPNLEIRNPKQIQNRKVECPKQTGTPAATLICVLDRSAVF
jgi:hypothetical protein